MEEQTFTDKPSVNLGLTYADFRILQQYATQTEHPAYRRVYNRMYLDNYGWIQKLLMAQNQDISHEDIEEIVTDTFIKFQFDLISEEHKYIGLTAYFLKGCRWKIMDKRKISRKTNDIEDAKYITIGSESDSIESRDELDFFLRVLEKGNLSETERDIFIDKHSGMSYDEIMLKYGKTYSSSVDTVRRAKNKLAESPIINWYKGKHLMSILVAVICFNIFQQ